MKIDQYCQRQRCKHVELEQFWHAFASRGFVSDSVAFLLISNAVQPSYIFVNSFSRTSNVVYQKGLALKAPSWTQKKF